MAASLEKFTPFPHLPIELRLKIWNKATGNIEPRLVNLFPKVKGNNIPAILHACHESRDEAQKQYSRCTIRPSWGVSQYSLLINYNSDSVCLNSQKPLDLDSPDVDENYGSIFSSLSLIHSEQVRGLVLGVEGTSLIDWWRTLDYLYKLYSGLMTLCPKLMELKFVLNASWAAAMRAMKVAEGIELVELPATEYMGFVRVLELNRVCLKQGLMFSLITAQLEGKLLPLKLKFMEFRRAQVEEVARG